VEHYCKECINDGNNLCKFTGALHTTGITCPSFKQKSEKEEVEMFKVGDRVRVVADETRLKAIALTKYKLTGVEGIITNIKEKYTLPTQVDFGTEYSGSWWLGKQDLELLEEEDNGLQGLNEPQPPIRTFDGEATRDTDQGKTRYGHPKFYEMLEAMAELHSRKNHDYAGTSDPLKNLRACGRLELKPFMGVMVRLQDKWSRLEEFVKSGKLMVKGESVKDTLMDNAVYSILAIILYEEQEEQEKASDQNSPDVGGH